MKLESILAWILFVIIAFLLAGYWIFNIVEIYHPKNNTITIQVTGVTNAINATTITSLHYECIKYCIYTFKTYDGNTQLRCYDARASLGDECKK